MQKLTSIKNIMEILKYGTNMILLIDDQDIVRLGLKQIFPDKKIVCANTISDAEQHVHAEETPYLVIAETSVSGESSFELVRRFCEQSCPVIMFTRSDSPAHLVEARNSGASGYILKSDPPEHLAELMKNIESTDDFTVSLGMQEKLDAGIHDRRISELTARELQIFRLLAEGKNYREIGELLFISPKTVNVHRRNIYSKLAIQGMNDLIKLALRIGIISGTEDAK